jgi:hypothetical protein
MRSNLWNLCYEIFRSICIYRYSGDYEIMWYNCETLWITRYDGMYEIKESRAKLSKPSVLLQWL